MTSRAHDRRGFLHGILAAGAVTAAGPVRMDAQAQPQARELTFLPPYARALAYKSLKQSSFDTTGGNGDRWPIAAGASKEVFNATGPGVITHIWFTIAARSADHLKEIVLRALLGRQREAERRGAGRRFLRPQSRRLPGLRIANTSRARPAAR